MKLRLAGTILAAGLIGALVGGIAFSAAPPGPLFATPLGQNENPDGDSDGRGGFTAIVDGDQLCYGLSVTNLDQPNGAHIHKGNAGENGPIVIGLLPPSTGDPGTSSACVTADPALLEDILRHPGLYYVNVHTSTFPGGAIRDQLVRQPH